MIGNGGKGGSGGTDGANWSAETGAGGVYGGGAAGQNRYTPSNNTPASAAGGKGAVRIIWGTGRAFPDTGTEGA